LGAAKLQSAPGADNPRYAAAAGPKFGGWIFSGAPPPPEKYLRGGAPHHYTTLLWRTQLTDGNY